MNIVESWKKEESKWTKFGMWLSLKGVERAKPLKVRWMKVKVCLLCRGLARFLFHSGCTADCPSPMAQLFPVLPWCKRGEAPACPYNSAFQHFFLLVTSVFFASCDAASSFCSSVSRDTV